MTWGSSGTEPGEFDRPTGVAVDGSGIIHVADFGNERIQKFSSTGTFLLEWGSPCLILSGVGCVDPGGGLKTGDGQFAGPSDVAVNGSGDVYVVDRGNHRIQKFLDDGTFVRKWGSMGATTGSFNRPEAITVDRRGAFYVADTGNHRIQKFGPLGSILVEWGDLGSGAGTFSSPTGIAVDGDDFSYVVDSGNNRAQKFRQFVTPVRPSTWGRIKARYGN